MQYTFFFFFLLFSSLCSQAQSWEKTYGGILTDEGASVWQTIDSGFILAGSTNSYGAGAFDFYLVRTDPSGDTIWTKTYGGMNNDNCNSVIQTLDGGFIACGKSNSFSNSEDIYIVKTDSGGTLMWSKVLGDSNSQSSQSIVQTTDSGYCIIGTTNYFPGNTSDILLIRTDQNGDTVWTKLYGRDILNIGYSIQQTPDNGFIISGASYNVNNNAYDVCLFKTNEFGDSLWTRYVSDASHAYGISVISNDSGFIVGGTRDENFLAISFDLNGNVNWQNEYDKDGLDRCFSMAGTGDKGYLLAGYTHRFGSSDVLVVKIDSAGNELWSKKYGGIQSEEAWSISSLNEGGFIAVGNSINQVNGSKDVYLIRSDCDFFPTVQISTLDTICLGDTIASTLISNISSGVTYQWLKNDTIISGANSSMYVASEHGTYELIVTDTNGCSNTSNEIFIYFPSAFFYVSPDEACPGDIVQMGNWNFGSDSYSFYDWDFGDGTTDTGLMVSHAYSDTGSYTITRSVRTSNGSCNQYAGIVNITTTALPPVDFDMQINNSNLLINVACPGDRIEYIPYAYTYWFIPPPPIAATTYHWDFGDGTSDTIPFPVHYYSQYGMFQVTLTVTNHCGNSSSLTDSILIDSSSNMNTNFNWIDGDGITNNTVIACEQVLFNSQGGIANHWDFGDGTTINSAADTITHAFSMSGTYLVQLITYNGCGHSDTISRSIIVTGACTGIFSPDFNSGSIALVFPNPFSSEAAIILSDLPGNSPASAFDLIIYDLQGKIAEKKSVMGPEIKLDRGKLSKGIYFFFLQNNIGIMWRGKFVVQ